MKINRRLRLPIYFSTLTLLLVPILLRGQTNVPQPPPILLGTAWYPEQWPESRWEADLTLMQQAGIHMVRVGEFAWSRMEPSEGQYDLDWLDRAVTLAAKHEIHTVLGTPTAAPPAWLTQNYPETLRVDEEGRRRGAWQPAAVQFCKSKISRDCSQDCGSMAKRFGHNP